MAIAESPAATAIWKLCAIQTNSNALAKDFIIHVTGFFPRRQCIRDLGATVIPDLVREKTSGQPLRVWIPACSTGEETYSPVMLLLEEIAAAKRNIKLQVFASDVEGDAVAFARNGLYPHRSKAEVSPARLARFFVKDDNGYRVVPELRAKRSSSPCRTSWPMPCFSRIDLVSCRNLLIYLRSEVQARCFPYFISRPAPAAFFFSAFPKKSERDAYFEPVSEGQPIYRHLGHSRLGEVAFPIGGGEGVRPRLSRIVPSVASRRTGLGDVSQNCCLRPMRRLGAHQRKCEALYYYGPVDNI